MSAYIFSFFEFRDLKRNEKKEQNQKQKFQSKIEKKM
jgi:hypothetical protein